MLKPYLEKLFPRKKRKKKRGSPTLESRQPASKRSKELPAYPRNRSSVKKRRRRIPPVLIRAGVYVGGVIALWVMWIFITLPDIDNLNKFTKAPSILVKAEDGTIIGSFGDIYGDYIHYNEFPRSLIDAVVATEDRNFFHHFGIDPLGLLRATFANIYAGHVVQGGSTITQQVAKNVFLTPERNLNRKVKEMLLALKLEHRFSKEDILSIYLNRVYLGAGSFGVDAAARRYFDKSARDLTLPESAIMAGLLKAPSRFAPTSNPTLSRQRAQQVILNMEDAGYLTEQQSQRARAELDRSMATRTKQTQSSLYFADWIMDQLPDYIGNIDQDIVVITTIRPAWQALAEKAIGDIMDKEGEPHLASQAALLSMTPDGAVRAMIGGRSYAKSQYNRATQSLRQPGSSFKIFVYLAGLEGGFTPDTTVEDKQITVPIVGGTWQPKNYTNKYLGTITLKEAVTESVNTVAVQVAQSVGLDHVIAMARRLGVTNDLIEVPSIALGSTELTLLELTTAYGHLAAQGAIVNPYGIIEVDTASGQPLYERRSSGAGMALSSGIVGQMNEMLMSVVENGTGRAARIGRPIAGKTGTTSDYRDAWFMGYTPDLVTGVWVGNDDNSPMKKVTGGMLPAQIWHNYMIAALASTPPSPIPTGGIFRNILPWQSNDVAPSQPEHEVDMEAHEQPAEPEQAMDQLPAPMPVTAQELPPVAIHAAAEKRDVTLDKSFWDKLKKVR